MKNKFEEGLSQEGALGFDSLGRDNGVPDTGEWHLNNIAPSLRDTFQRLYQDKRVRFFDNTQPLLVGSPYNVNQLEAANQLISWLVREEGHLFHVDSCMGAGTSSLLAYLTDVFKEQSEALQHVFGAEQYGGKKEIVTHAIAGGRSTGVQTEVFTNSEGLFSLLTEMDEKKRIVVIDETQFTEGGGDEGFWEEVKRWAEQTDRKVVVGQLNLMYTGEPWDVTKAVVQVADGGVVVAARGIGAGKKAWMTRREVRLEDGRIRPDSLGAEREIVGDVFSQQREHIYAPVHWKDFNVSTEEEANAFDMSDLKVFKR